MTTAIVLTLSGKDRPGIVAAVTGLLAENGGNILEARQFDDVASGRFLIRVEFRDREPANLRGQRN